MLKTKKETFLFITIFEDCLFQLKKLAVDVYTLTSLGIIIITTIIVRLNIPFIQHFKKLKNIKTALYLSTNLFFFFRIS